VRDKVGRANVSLDELVVRIRCLEIAKIVNAGAVVEAVIVHDLVLQSERECGRKRGVKSEK
jgi:hypothetical protein